MEKKILQKMKVGGFFLDALPTLLFFSIIQIREV
jgi:hypothetical protein